MNIKATINKLQKALMQSGYMWRDIVAYDAMYDIINSSAVNWYNTILPNKDSKVTMKQFRTSFVNHFGLEQEEITLANDDMIVEKTIEVGEGTEIDNETEQISILKESSLSGKDVITAICEINGCFGHIGRDGKFHYIYLTQDMMGLYPSNTLFPDHAPDYLPQAETGHLYPQSPKSSRIGKGSYISANYEDYICRKINKLQIRQKENDIGSQYPDGSVENENTYIIEDNFLIYGKSAADLSLIAKNIFEKIKDVVYRPFSADCIGNPCLEVGDAVRLSTRYELIESYILKRTLKGIQALRDDYSAEGTERYSEKVNSVSSSIIQLKGKTNTLTRNVEQTISEIYALDENGERYSRIEQNANAISTEVTNRKDGENKLSSRISQTATSIKMSVSNGEKTAGISISLKNEKGEEIAHDDGDIVMTGIVTFKNLTGEEGETRINGALLETGTVSCDTLNGGTINGQTINGGMIIGGSISGGTITGTKVVSDEITAVDKIKIRNYENTRSVTLEVMTSGEADILSVNKSVFINKNLTSGNFTSYGNVQLRKTDENGNVDNQEITAIFKDGEAHDVVSVNKDQLTTTIGWSGDTNNKQYNTILKLRGKTVTATNNGGVTVQSDERLKNSFKTLDEFDSVYMDIEPCAFKYNNGTSGRYHFGAKAQNIKEAFEKHGYTTQDFGGFVQMADNPENEDYCGIDDPMGIIYTEFTMWNTHMIQKLCKKIEEQQSEIDLLKKSVSFLMEGAAKHE